MKLSQEEIKRLEEAKKLFKTQALTKEQVELILCRELTDEIWKAYIISENRKHKNIKDKVYSEQPSFRKSTDQPHFNYSDIAKHAAKKGQRRLKSKHQDTVYRVAGLFKSRPNRDGNKNSYTVEKIKEYNFEKFNTTRSRWKVSGDVDIFQIHSVLEELIEKMTEGKTNNVKLQISLENDKNDKVYQTQLLNKAEMIEKLQDWVVLFVDYDDMEIEDITFKLLKIEIPTGSGRRVNKIITVDSKRSIIQIKNNDTICLARAIVVGLAVHNKEKLQYIFKDNIRDSELKEINKSRRKELQSKIREGEITENEITYIKKGRTLQTVLAQALHRICNVSIKENGNDFEDVRVFEKQLDIEI